jgi:hypothetical protein
MPINFGLLSNAALTGLGEQERADLQKQATTQFLLGSLLSNDPAMGLRSALSVPEQYSTAQKAITEARQKASQRQAVAGFQQKYLPTQFDESSPQFTGPVTPDVEARQNELVAARAQGLPFNIQNALQDVLRLDPSVQGPIRESITALQPKAQGNFFRNANNEIVAGIPSFDARTGTVVNPTVQGGVPTFNVTDAPGFVDAVARNTLPPLKPGQEYVFDRGGKVTGIKNASGAIQALTESTLAQGRAEGQARLETTPTNVIQPGTGRTVRTTEANAIGGVTALSPSEVQAFESYKPIRDQAFRGLESANSSDASLQNMQNILNRGAFKPGKFAGVRSEVASIATGLGVGGERAKSMATDAPLFVQSISDITSSRIQEMAGAISNADITFSASRGPQITNPEEAVQYYIDLNRTMNKRKKDYYNFVAKNPVPDVVERWSQTPQGSASVYEDPKMRKYLPSFPVTSGPDKGKKAFQLPSGVFRVYD